MTNRDSYKTAVRNTVDANPAPSEITPLNRGTTEVTPEPAAVKRMDAPTKKLLIKIAVDVVLLACGERENLQEVVKVSTVCFFSRLPDFVLLSLWICVRARIFLR